MKRNLLPCPFCGTAALLQHTSGSLGYSPSTTIVKCPSLECAATPQVEFPNAAYDWEKHRHVELDGESAAIQAWNKRKA